MAIFNIVYDEAQGSVLSFKATHVPANFRHGRDKNEISDNLSDKQTLTQTHAQAVLVPNHFA